MPKASAIVTKLETLSNELDEMRTVLRLSRLAASEQLEHTRRAERQIGETLKKLDQILTDPKLPDWRKPGTPVERDELIEQEDARP